MNPMDNAQMQSDAQLSPEIFPASAPVATIRRVFVTGATGFLGSQLLGELLRTTDWDIVCLVRADDDKHMQQRLEQTFGRARLVAADLVAARSRVSGVRGNACAPLFGLEPMQYAGLAGDVDAVIHGAAEVSWIKPYRRLRGSHVAATLNAIRLACELRGKVLYVISTLAVCYAADGPAVVDEATDMAPFVGQMSLGYAQAKCVSESLLRTAARRGLAVGILRSGLVCGHSRSGESNQQDLISRAIRGSTQSNIAADIDWQIDCVPVDTAAQVLSAMVRTGFAQTGTARVMHLQHDAPRSWRELVLSLRLRGYPLQLVPLDRWLAHVDGMGKDEQSDLRVLRPFFLARPAGLGGRSQMEMFLEPGRSRISSGASQRWLAQQGIVIPRLDARLLNQYFAAFIANGFLPPGSLPAANAVGVDELRSRLEAVLRIDNFTATPMGSETGILSELAAARSGGRTGMWRCEGTLREPGGPRLDAVLKLKAGDEEQDALMLVTAALCSDELARAFSKHLDGLPYRRAAARELAIGLTDEIRMAQHMPATFAFLPAGQDGISGMLYEYLAEAEFLDEGNQGKQWGAAHLRAAIHGLGDIHSVWLGREQELLAAGWISDSSCGPGLLAMQPLWRALAQYAGPRLEFMCGRSTMATHLAWIDTMQQWLPLTFSMPRTLIHNDFNPRNMAFRHTAAGLDLCAYDWELATVGLPQYDLAELLCHMLPAKGRARVAAQAIEEHRLALEAASGHTLAPAQWRMGMALALRCFIVFRLPMYIMIDRFRPQTFLPSVVRNAWWLAEWLADGTGDDAELPRIPARHALDYSLLID